MGTRNKRGQAMGEIDALLLQQQQNAPKPEPGKSVTEETTGEDTQSNQAKSDRARLIEEAEAARQAELDRQKQISDLQKSAEQTIKSASGVIRDTKVRLESVPTPGSIALPLLVLIVLLMAIVVVNGHTRIVWLWRAIIGAAAVQKQQGQAATFSAPVAPTNAGTTPVTLLSSTNGAISTSPNSPIPPFSTGGALTPIQTIGGAIAQPGGTSILATFPLEPL